MAFILLPGSAGALVAVSLARWLPGSRRRIFWIIGIVTTAIIIYFTMTIWRDNAIASLQSSGWIEHVFTQRDAIRGPLLPHTWLAAGLQAAIDRRAGEAMFYLMVTAANGLMAALIAVYIGGRWLPATCALTSTGNSRPQRITAITVPRFVNLFAFVWPKPVRLQVCKDLLTLMRDPLQWTQLVIFFGLLLIYITNVPNLSIDLGDNRWQQLIAFLNLTASSLILTTFTSRFVYPLVSLEGQHLWLLGMLPYPREVIITGKFAYATLVSASAALAVMILSDYVLGVTPMVWAVHIGVTLLMCVGLSGIAVGTGAMMPDFTQRNPAQIAAGLGGTVSLILSVAFITLMLLGTAFLCFTVLLHDPTNPLQHGRFWAVSIALLVLGIVAAVVPIKLGARRFAYLSSEG